MSVLVTAKKWKCNLSYGKDSWAIFSKATCKIMEGLGRKIQLWIYGVITLVNCGLGKYSNANTLMQILYDTRPTITVSCMHILETAKSIWKWMTNPESGSMNNFFWKGTGELTERYIRKWNFESNGKFVS